MSPQIALLGLAAVVILAVICAGAEGSPDSESKKAAPTQGEAELLAEIRELKRRRVIDRGGA
jgi:hypothetical protein